MVISNEQSRFGLVVEGGDGTGGVHGQPRRGYVVGLGDQSGAVAAGTADQVLDHRVDVRHGKVGRGLRHRLRDLTARTFMYFAVVPYRGFESRLGMGAAVRFWGPPGV